MLTIVSRIGGYDLTNDRWNELHQQMLNVSCPELASYVP